MAWVVGGCLELSPQTFCVLLFGANLHDLVHLYITLVVQQVLFDIHVTMSLQWEVLLAATRPNTNELMKRKQQAYLLNACCCAFPRLYQAIAR